MHYMTRRDVSNCVQMHKTLMSAFPEVLNGGIEGSFRVNNEILYRIDSNRKKSNLNIIVQSKIRPDWTKLPKNYYLRSQTKKIDHVLKVIVKDAVFRFKLQANPTMIKTSDEKKQRIPIRGKDQQIQWLLRKGLEHGFELISVCLDENVPNFFLRNRDLVEGYKERNGSKESKMKLTFFSKTFEGILKVVDEKRFLAAYKNGIGRGKAFGFGLLSLG